MEILAFGMPSATFLPVMSPTLTYIPAVDLETCIKAASSTLCTCFTLLSSIHRKNTSQLFQNGSALLIGTI